MAGAGCRTADLPGPARGGSGIPIYPIFSPGIPIYLTTAKKVDTKYLKLLPKSQVP